MSCQPSFGGWESGGFLSFTVSLQDREGFFVASRHKKAESAEFQELDKPGWSTICPWCVLS